MEGCHDVGYVQSLRSEMTAGFGEKLVLLHGYRVSEPKIDQLGLPSIRIPNLFIEEKLVPSQPRALPTGLSYSSVAQAEAPPPARNSTSTLVPADGRASPSQRFIVLDKDTVEYTSHHIEFPANWPIHGVLQNIKELKPPPCTFWYLTNHCKSDCIFGHFYILQPEHKEMLKAGAKSSPCIAVNNSP